MKKRHILYAVSILLFLTIIFVMLLFTVLTPLNPMVARKWFVPSDESLQDYKGYEWNLDRGPDFYVLYLQNDKDDIKAGCYIGDFPSSFLKSGSKVDSFSGVAAGKTVRWVVIEPEDETEYGKEIYDIVKGKMIYETIFTYRVKWNHYPRRVHLWFLQSSDDEKEYFVDWAKNLVFEEKRFISVFAGRDNKTRNELWNILIEGSSTNGGIRIDQVEKELGLNSPINMQAPTATDPLWWLTYRKGKFFIELGTNTEIPVYNLENANGKNFVYTGYFKLMDENEYRLKCLYSTYCMPTYYHSNENEYSIFLRDYDMRKPISIKGLEEKLRLDQPMYVGLPVFTSPFHEFCYRKSNCFIRLGGIALREGIRNETEAINHRSEFLFNGYWVAICRD